MTAPMIDKAGLRVAAPLADFIEQQALPGTGIAPDAFWAGAADVLARFAPENLSLLRKRDTLQAQIDSWHEQRAGQPHDPAAYAIFLREIGYLVPEPAPFQIGSTNVDDEVAGRGEGGPDAAEDPVSGLRIAVGGIAVVEQLRLPHGVAVVLQRHLTTYGF
ncbi:MAG: hypothetical protein U9R64_04590, partial [Pseudomonadota bacterium]|nr:hypothetical protein [Pseudomonadota bacterium]